MRWWEVAETALQPLAAEQVHIVGEAFASPDGHGWVNGAVETAERFLVNKMGLAPLAGLTRDDICLMNPFAAQQPPV